MDTDEECEREPNGGKLRREFMYEQEIRDGIEKLLDYKYGLVGIDPEEVSTSTVSELVRAIALVTEEDMTAQLTKRTMNRVLVYRHNSETTPSGFSFLAFGHK
ncbi:hypothetical protein M1567_02465 [Candidatus Marsarchaeota archaeon]|nr:hypothetical protein [Candidatus Marsarchaeota archaeon]